MSLYLNDDAFQITFETLWIINFDRCYTPRNIQKPALNLEWSFPLQNLQHLRGVRVFRSSLKRRGRARLAKWSLAFPFARSRPSQIRCHCFCSSDSSVTFSVLLSFMKEYLIFYFYFPASHLRGVYPCRSLKFWKEKKKDFSFFRSLFLANSLYFSTARAHVKKLCEITIFFRTDFTYFCKSSPNCECETINMYHGR
jgi:hypothetical protein